MIASNDPELFKWLDKAAVAGGSFVKTIAMAGLRADSENYALLRPVLLELKAKYPTYATYPKHVVEE
jgi:hypothetical protein